MKIHATSISNGLQSPEWRIISEKIDRASISDRIGQGFESQQNHSVEGSEQTLDMTQDIQAIKGNDYRSEETNQAGATNQWIITRLDTLINEFPDAKTVEAQTGIWAKTRPVKDPPFNLDAIDLWDDVTYVATSQGARCILKTGASSSQAGNSPTSIVSTGQVNLQDPAGQFHPFLAEVELMEIVLAILLLFGGFALGSISSENGGNESQFSIEPAPCCRCNGIHRSPHGQIDLIPIGAIPDGAVIYRDLTIPYSGRTGDCEGKCPEMVVI